MAETTFQGLHIAVTGGTGALGRGVIEILLASGGTCHIPSYAPQELDDFPWRYHPNVHLYEGLDLTDEAAVEELYEGLPRLWASIHCAGGFAMSPLTDTRLADLDRLWQMNVVSCFLCCREAVRNFRRGAEDDTSVGGRLVNVAARPALEGRTGASMTAYTVSKSAVAAMTQALGEELAQEDILVNAVAPSIIDSPANRQAMAEADHRLWPSPKDIAETLVFLASPHNRTTRSAVVPVYGRS